MINDIIKTIILNLTENTISLVFFLLIFFVLKFEKFFYNGPEP